MKFLITGGNGYIGENLFKQLRHWGKYTEIYISDYHIGSFPLAQNLRDEHFKDLDAVIHLAAVSGIEACNADREKAFTSNVISAFNVFSRARDNGVPVIFTSSQAANDPSSSEYAYQKWSIEQMARSINQDGGGIYVLRLANVYGGYKYLEKKNTVVKQFISQYELGENIGVHGNGNQTRDFIHVEDVCEAIKLIIDYATVHNMEYHFNQNKPIDVGTGIETSILDLAYMFKGARIAVAPAREVGTESNVANIKKIKKLGFKPKHSLKEYIENMKWREEVVKNIFED